MSANEKKALIEALEKICCALTWVQPSCTSACEEYLKEAWVAIDKLKEGGDD